MEIILDKCISLLPEKKIDIFGKDSLMNHSFPYYLLAFLMGSTVFGGYEIGFLFIFLIYAVLPLLD